MDLICRSLSRLLALSLCSLAAGLSAGSRSASAQSFCGGTSDADINRSSRSGITEVAALQPQHRGVTEIVSAELSAADLPEAPSFYSAEAGNFRADATAQQVNGAPTRQDSGRPRFAPNPIAPLYDKYIEEGQTAQPLLGVRRKVLFGLDQMISPYYLLSIVAAAGYQQALNGSPNYGTNLSAFSQRVGAAAATNASQSIFTDGVMPAVFHQDPRYYVKGPGHGVLARGGNAISRVFITRSDTGENTPNYSLFAGHAATAALQNAYYPPVNQGVMESAKSFANSFAGTALSNGIREFFPDLLHLAHLE